MARMLGPTRNRRVSPPPNFHAQARAHRPERTADFDFSCDHRSVAPVVTIRPNKPTAVNLPFQPGGENYRLLKGIRGPGTREPRWNPAEKVFEVPHAGTDRLIEGLVEEFGRVRVVVFGHVQTVCVRECWNAKANRAWECVCSCAGANHGSGHPLTHEVADGLSVEHGYSVARFDVDAAGWHFRR